MSRKPLTLGVSTSTFVPKPFTPFQWEAQIPLEEIERKQNLLKGILRPLNVKYSYHDGKTSRIETVFARGDEKMNRVIKTAYESGCIFDSWTEFFDYDKWLSAFEKCGVDSEDYCGEQDLDKPLAWERIEVGVSRGFLLSERDKSRKCELTHDCRNGCNNCGINREYPSAFRKNCIGGGK